MLRRIWFSRDRRYKNITVRRMRTFAEICTSQVSRGKGYDFWHPLDPGHLTLDKIRL